MARVDLKLMKLVAGDSLPNNLFPCSKHERDTTRLTMLDFYPLGRLSILLVLTGNILVFDPFPTRPEYFEKIDVGKS